MVLNRYVKHYSTPVIGEVNLRKLDQQRIYDEQHIQDAVVRVLNEITDKVDLDSRITDPQSLVSTTTTMVQHKLGRKVEGFIIVDKNANADIWRDTTSDADLTKFLPLKCDVNVTITLKVF